MLRLFRIWMFRNLGVFYGALHGSMHRVAITGWIGSTQLIVMKNKHLPVETGRDGWWVASISFDSFSSNSLESRTIVRTQSDRPENGSRPSLCSPSESLWSPWPPRTATAKKFRRKIFSKMFWMAKLSGWTGYQLSWFSWQLDLADLFNFLS